MRFIAFATASVMLLAACGPAATDAPGREPTVVDGGVRDDGDDDDGLAPGAVIRVEIDQTGREIVGTAEMRLVDGAGVPSDEGDPLAVEAAFLAGGAPERLAAEDELDRDTSTQSWHDYRRESNFVTYKPQARTGSKRVVYRSPSKCQKGKYRYYYYPKPKPKPKPAPCRTGCGGGGGTGGGGASLDAELRRALDQAGVRPLDGRDFLVGSEAAFELGRMLFFDPLLSGNKNTACATCHVPSQGTSNAMSLGPTLKAREDRRRAYGTSDLLPRNAPALFNLGHRSYQSMFWDSRITTDPGAPGGYRSPAGTQLPAGLSGPLAAQALFPLASREEMLGCLGQNELAGHADGNFGDVWRGVVQRVTGVPRYQSLIAAAYPGQTAIGPEHLANALAVYQAMAWRSDDAPFDRYLRGDAQALSPQQKQGALYFYGKARCSFCHAGALQTDHQHHAIAIPQFGPGIGKVGGKGVDWGLAAVTGNPADRYKFRTPTLRNVTLTGPWGHNGAYNSLRGFVEHYRAPVQAMQAWNKRQVVLPFRIQDGALFAAHDDPAIRSEVAAATPFPGIAMTDQEVDAILAFLEALTDPRMARLGATVPHAVPSGFRTPEPYLPRPDVTLVVP